MKLHTSNFKNAIKKLGMQQNVKITYTINETTTVLTGEDINEITSFYNGNLLKSIMKELVIDSNSDIAINTEIKFEYGVLVNDSYEFISFGKYIVYSSEKEDDNSYEIKCYDKMLYSMKDYEELTVEYPITINNFLSALCTKIGLTLKASTYANMSKQLTYDVFKGIGYTYRDVLDDIAEVTGGTICISSDDKVEIRYINNTNDTIDEEYLKDVNVNFGKKYGPINSVVLSRGGGADNIYLRNEQSVTANGLCEIKIVDNQIMNFNDRNEYLTGLLQKLDGIQYYLNDFDSTGIAYYDFLDKYNIQIGNKTYSCIMFNDELIINQGIEENIYTEIPETSETDYKKADKTDQKINQTTLIVDKQEQQIQGLITQIGDRSTKITTITADLDGIQSKVENTAEYKNSNEGTTEVHLEDAGENEILKLKVDGNVTYKTNLYPSTGLYPSTNLHPNQKI